MISKLRVQDCELYYIPVLMSSPLQFGRATVRGLDCLRVRLTAEAEDGRLFHGWGETPLNIGWAWPEGLDTVNASEIIRNFCSEIASAWTRFAEWGHALDLGYRFLMAELPRLRIEFGSAAGGAELPSRAAFLCAAAFDIALHDAYGQATDRPIFAAYSAQMSAHDLSWYFGSADSRFKDKYPSDYFSDSIPVRLPVWHLVGCGDTVTGAPHQSTSDGVDAHPRSLSEWIEQDGLTRFKIKMCGSSLEWDYSRVLDVGRVAENLPSSLLSLDFNGTAPDASYVTSILSKLSRDAPSTYDRISYVEQPFSAEQPHSPSALAEISALKQVFVDEGATGWEETRKAYAAGYAGVALKTCKTQTAAILSGCWAREYGMRVSVQDLTNPMLAQIPHVLLAAHFSPELGVESNSMQFCPEASRAEARVHPYLYDRRDGMLDLSTIHGPGFGYRIEEICRELPERVA